MHLLPNVSSDSRWEPLSGGSINDVYRICEPSGATFVAKVNRADRFPGMFAAESEGLHMLHNHLNVPRVIGLYNKDSLDILLLEDLGVGIPTDAFYISLGEQLARMHLKPQPTYGLSHNNFIGRLQQSNTPRSNWAMFYQHERLEPQVEIAHRNGLLNQGHLKLFDRLYFLLPRLFPNEPPALLHGDLWSGNVHCSQNGAAYFIDPAVYVGHREMDIAMTKLFGSFANSFYDAYQAVYPLDSGWRERESVCNLYPNLVHLNLFGKGYLRAVEQGLKLVK